MAFTLFQSSSFTYVVSVARDEGNNDFTGVVKKQSRQKDLGGLEPPTSTLPVP